MIRRILPVILLSAALAFGSLHAAHLQPDQSKSEDTKNQVVYKTRTGAKYHRDGCRYLKSRIQTTVKSAKAAGLTPCSVCRPPS